MFKGSLPALVTPFKDGAVDFDALKQLVNWQIEEGSNGLVPVGTTGESPTLTHEEHEAVIEATVEAAAGRVPVIAGAGSNNTAETLRFMEHAKRVGAAAGLVVTPYYNKPTQRGLYRPLYRHRGGSRGPFLFVIYNIPGRSVVDMSPDTMGATGQGFPEYHGALKTRSVQPGPRQRSMQRMKCGKDFIQAVRPRMQPSLGFNAHGGCWLQFQ